MSLKQLAAHIKNDGLKQRILNQFNDETKPKKVLKYINNWRFFVVSIRIIASVFSLGIAPLVYLVWAKHKKQKHLNWITKPLAETDDAVVIFQGACDQDNDSSQTITNIKHTILPHDRNQSKATLVTLLGKKANHLEQENSIDEEAVDGLEFDQLTHATILVNGKILLRKKAQDVRNNSHHQFVIYNDKNECEKICFTENDTQEKFPFISPDLLLFSSTNGTLLIHDETGTLVMKLQHTNIPHNSRLIPINFYIKEDKFYVFVASETEGVITLHKFSNNYTYNSSSILFESPSEAISAFTYNPSTAMIYIIDSAHRIHSIKTNLNKPHSPTLDGTLSDLPESTQINKLSVSLDGQTLYVADTDGNIYQYQTEDFKIFTRIISLNDIEGEILDLKCLEEPKYIDPKKRKLLIVTTQQMYSKSLSDLSVAFRESDSLDQKPPIKPKEKPIRFEISHDNQTIKVEKNSSKLPVIVITDRKNDTITAKYYHPTTGYIYAGTQQGYLHIAQIDPVKATIIAIDIDKEIKKLGKGPITVIEPIKITDGKESIDLLLIRHEDGLASLYHTDDITHIFDASCDADSAVFLDEHQNLVARNSVNVDAILCNKKDLLKIMNLSTSPRIAENLAKKRSALHRNISVSQGYLESSDSSGLVL